MKIKIKEIKQLVREVLEENELSEMARIATGFVLAPDWESKWNAVPDGLKNSVRYQRIISYLQDTESLPKDYKGGAAGTLKDLAMKKFNSTDTAAVNQLIRTLKDLGVVVNAGEMAARKADTETGSSTDPKVTLARKIKAGDMNFTPEELAVLKGLSDGK
jgi:hypothetical protein